MATETEKMIIAASRLLPKKEQSMSEQECHY